MQHLSHITEDVVPQTAVPTISMKHHNHAVNEDDDENDRNENDILATVLYSN